VKLGRKSRLLAQSKASGDDSDSWYDASEYDDYGS